jgi:hypothetical protein
LGHRERRDCQNALRVRAPLRRAGRGYWANLQSICVGLYDRAAAAIEDSDLRQALLRGIGETGVPTIEREWLPASKQSEIGAAINENC